MMYQFLLIALSATMVSATYDEAARDRIANDLEHAIRREVGPTAFVIALGLREVFDIRSLNLNSKEAIVRGVGGFMTNSDSFKEDMKKVDALKPDVKKMADKFEDICDNKILLYCLRVKEVLDHPAYGSQMADFNFEDWYARRKYSETVVRTGAALRICYKIATEEDICKSTAQLYVAKAMDGFGSDSDSDSDYDDDN